MQPGPRQTPLPVDRAQRDAEGGGDFFMRQSSEEAQFYYLRLPRVGHRELIEGLINGDNVKLARLSAGLVPERHLHRLPQPLSRPTGSRMIDEDPAHQLRRYREEVSAILPSWILCAQANVRLVHETGGLKSLARA